MVNGQWSMLETGGALMIANDQRCARCHNDTSAVAGPIVAGAIRQPDNWIATHIADPEMIAPGIRPAPQTNQAANRAIMAAITRLRLEPMPAVPPDDARAIMLVTRECVTCHKIEGAGGKEGPELKNIASKYDLARLQLRITDPLLIKEDSEMPAFGDTLTPDDILAIAKWVIRR
jgi:mono/diheme cytochrome c family protein